MPCYNVLQNWIKENVLPEGICVEAYSARVPFGNLLKKTLMRTFLSLDYQSIQIQVLPTWYAM